MQKLTPSSILLIGGISLVTLTGCEQLEQKASNIVEQTKQTATQTLDEIRQAQSLEEATRSATDALQTTREQANGLLNEVGGLLSGENQEQMPEESMVDQPASDS